MDENTKFLALYHFGDTMTDLDFDLDRVGMKGALVADCLTRTFLGFKDAIHVENATPHSAAMFLLRKPADEPTFVGSDANIYMGINLFSSVYEDSRLTVTRPADTHENAVAYALWPASYTPEGEVVWTEKGYTLTKLN